MASPSSTTLLLSISSSSDSNTKKKKKVPFTPFVHKKTEAQNSYFSVEIEPPPFFFRVFNEVC
jgi:hypothetical protein